MKIRALAAIAVLVVTSTTFGRETVDASMPSSEEVGAAAATDLFTKASSAVVGITCRTNRGVYFGTGVLIDPSGIVMTSVTVVPRGAIDINIYLPGGRVAACRPLLDVAEKEISLIRVRRLGPLIAKGAKGLPYLKLGDSSTVAPGDAVFTLGNSFHSIENDDQVTLAAGVVSGLFDLREKRSESTYVGMAIETSAALNNGMDGGPLVDAEGRIVGLLSLNYSPSRWLGTAIPVNELKPLIAKHRDWFDDRRFAEPQHERNGKPRNTLGIEIEEIAGKDLGVLSVREDGPAARAGLAVGDRLISFGSSKLESLDQFRKLFAELSPGKSVQLTISRGKEERELSVRPWGRF